jgi:hypothetical protein
LIDETQCLSKVPIDIGDRNGFSIPGPLDRPSVWCYSSNGIESDVRNSLEHLAFAHRPQGTCNRHNERLRIIGKSIGNYHYVRKNSRGRSPKLSSPAGTGQKGEQIMSLSINVSGLLGGLESAGASLAQAYLTKKATGQTLKQTDYIGIGAAAAPAVLNALIPPSDGSTHSVLLTDLLSGLESAGTLFAQAYEQKAADGQSLHSQDYISLATASALQILGSLAPQPSTAVEGAAGTGPQS